MSEELKSCPLPGAPIVDGLAPHLRKPVETNISSACQDAKPVTNKSGPEARCANSTHPYLKTQRREERPRKKREVPTTAKFSRRGKKVVADIRNEESKTVRAVSKSDKKKKKNSGNVVGVPNRPATLDEIDGQDFEWDPGDQVTQVIFKSDARRPAGPSSSNIYKYLDVEPANGITEQTSLLGDETPFMPDFSEDARMTTNRTFSGFEGLLDSLKSSYDSAHSNVGPANEVPGAVLPIAPPLKIGPLNGPEEDAPQTQHHSNMSDIEDLMGDRKPMPAAAGYVKKIDRNKKKKGQKDTCDLVKPSKPVDSNNGNLDWHELKKVNSVEKKVRVKGTKVVPNDELAKNKDSASKEGSKGEKSQEDKPKQTPEDKRRAALLGLKLALESNQLNADHDSYLRNNGKRITRAWHARANWIRKMPLQQQASVITDSVKDENSVNHSKIPPAGRNSEADGEFYEAWQEFSGFDSAEPTVQAIIIKMLNNQYIEKTHEDDTSGEKLPNSFGDKESKVTNSEITDLAIQEMTAVQQILHPNTYENEPPDTTVRRPLTKLEGAIPQFPLSQGDDLLMQGIDTSFLARGQRCNQNVQVNGRSLQTVDYRDPDTMDYITWSIVGATLNQQQSIHDIIDYYPFLFASRYEFIGVRTSPAHKPMDSKALAYIREWLVSTVTKKELLGGIDSGFHQSHLAKNDLLIPSGIEITSNVSKTNAVMFVHCYDVFAHQYCYELYPSLVKFYDWSKQSFVKNKLIELSNYLFSMNILDTTELKSFFKRLTFKHYFALLLFGPIIIVTLILIYICLKLAVVVFTAVRFLLKHTQNFLNYNAGCCGSSKLLPLLHLVLRIFGTFKVFEWESVYNSMHITYSNCPEEHDDGSTSVVILSKVIIGPGEVLSSGLHFRFSDGTRYHQPISTNYLQFLSNNGGGGSGPNSNGSVISGGFNSGSPHGFTFPSGIIASMKGGGALLLQTKEVYLVIENWRLRMVNWALTGHESKRWLIPFPPRTSAMEELMWALYNPTKSVGNFTEGRSLLELKTMVTRHYASWLQIVDSEKLLAVLRPALSNERRWLSTRSYAYQGAIAGESTHAARRSSELNQVQRSLGQLTSPPKYPCGFCCRLTALIVCWLLVIAITVATTLYYNV